MTKIKYLCFDVHVEYVRYKYLIKLIPWFALYFGETIRHFQTRISERMGILVCTDKSLSKLSFSNILSHHQSSGHATKPEDFCVLTSCSSFFELLLRESLLISKFQLSLNANLRSVPLILTFCYVIHIFVCICMYM